MQLNPKQISGNDIFKTEKSSLIGKELQLLYGARQGKNVGGTEVSR